VEQIAEEKRSFSRQIRTKRLVADAPTPATATATDSNSNATATTGDAKPGKDSKAGFQQVRLRLARDPAWSVAADALVDPAEWIAAYTAQTSG
jgi:hypothetical protein